MNFWEIDEFILFLVFFIPGFISLKIYNLLIPGERRDFSSSFYEAIGYSALNFAALSWLIILIHSNNFYIDHRFLYFLSIFIIIFVAPIVWPIVFLKLSSWPPFKKHIKHPIEKPWDYVFRQRKAFWVIVHLNNGKKVGGMLGKNSFASSYPTEEEIYLEELWELDDEGRFIKPIERSKGMIILGGEILAVEFFE